jgi:hypothetical protein
VKRSLAAAGLAMAAICSVRMSTADGPPSRERGWKAFLDVASVLQSPRCQSCHVAGEAPLQGDDGHAHTMNVKRGADGRGTPALHCTTCHQTENSDLAHAPPGAPDWRLPPPSMKMAWAGLRPDALCESLKDPARNGGRTLAAVEEHLRQDAIVGWGFSPGPGRQPPRLSRADFLARFVEWKDAGAPCGTAPKETR